MAYTRRQQWLPANRYALKSPHAMKAEFVTIHNTANDASAANEINFMLRNDSATSYHVAIDDKEVVEAIPFARNAWHAGDGANGPGNRKSIGIEICYSKSGGKRYKEAEANAIEYTAQVLVQLGLPASAVKFHQEWSGKNCPHRILNEKRGNAFKQAIARRVEQLKAPAPKPTAPQPAPPKPAPVKPSVAPSRALKRVIVDGKQVGAFSQDEGVLKTVADALERKAKNIRIEDV